MIVPFPLIAQNVGVGTITPLQKVHIFSSASGNSSPTFGPLLIERNTNAYINLMTPATAESGVLFGNPSNASHGGIVYNGVNNQNGFHFRTNGNITRVLLNKDGLLGIGNIDPGYLLDVSGRMRVRSGGSDPVSAGIWFNNHIQNPMGFIGMENNTYLGLFGNTPSGGWRFAMNVNNGALKINGSEGQPGEVLESNGPNQAPAWKKPNSLYDNTIRVFGTNSVLVKESDGYVSLPGASHTFTLTSPAKVLVFVNGYAHKSAFAFTGRAIITLVLNGNNNGFYDKTIDHDDTPSSTITGSHLFQLSAGTYTLELKGSVKGGDVSIGASGQGMIIQIIPQ